MLFAITCTDKPGHLELRMETRSSHLDYLNSLGDTLKAAGPFLDDDGEPTGSLIVIEADNRIEAIAIAGADPYAKAGLFESVDIRPWRWAIKNPES